MPETPPNTTKPEAHLSKFGLSEFRSGQREVISTVLSGEDCLCIMPTGGGKSLCYQLPAVAREGVALVVSPLIALMKDQVDALTERNVHATYINSTLTPQEQSQRLQQMAAGQYDLVYIAPERFRSHRFRDAIRDTSIQLLAVDEAHCISEWGHDFRHDYTRLGEFRKQIGNPQTIGLTATATADVRQDIAAQLRLSRPKIFVAGFARENLHYSAVTARNDADKQRVLIDFLQKTPGSGIIYCATRKRCEDVAAAMRTSTNRKVAVYHGGMETDARKQAQDDFMSGRHEIVVATNAFGMGIDKANVRFVAHYNLPGTLEAYYQEAGRAGRDGLPSKCLLIYAPADRYIQEFFIDSNNPPREVIAEVYEFLRHQKDDPIELTQQEIKEELGLSIAGEGVGTVEQLLQRAGVLNRLEPRENKAAVRITGDHTTLVDLYPKQATNRRKIVRAAEKLVGDRREEYIYLRLEQLAAMADLPMPATTKALRECAAIEQFDYVPPFRGRAVHMVRTDLSFGQLDIDFEKLERRRKAEFEKLDAMVRYVNDRSCRQLVILRYFGETDGHPCGTCDRCPSHSQPTGATATETTTVDSIPVSPGGWETERGLLIAVRMTLSGVARTQGRFGKGVIAQMLAGSKAQKMSKFQLDQLSTYGLLSDLKLDEVTNLIDNLMDTGLIEQTDVDRFRPVLQLSPIGEEVMRGATDIPGDLSLPKVLRAKLAIYDDKDVESKEKPVPRPAPKPEEPTVSLTKTETVSTAQKTQEAHPHGQQAVRPDHYWTWRLIDAGFTPDECAHIRRLKPPQVIDHLHRALDDEMPLDVSLLLTSQQRQAIDTVVRSVDSSQLRQCMEKLAIGLRYEELELYLRCRFPGALATD